MDDKIEQYLLDINNFVDVDTYNAMVRDADKLDTKSWLNKYQDMAQKDETLAATWREYGFDKYSKDKYDRYAEVFGSSETENPYDKPEVWLKATWQSDFEDIPREEFMSDIANMSKYWQDYKAEGDRKAGIEQRKREIEKDWSLLKKMLASDYSKQRYIHEPEKSVFSDKGEWYNKGEDVSDVMLGILGLAGDFTPGVGGVVLGPGARAIRDIRHISTDSPYKKNTSEMLRDIAADAGLNYGAYHMANIKKADNIVKDVVSDEVKNAMNVADESLGMTNSLKDLSKFRLGSVITEANNDKALYDYVKSMPDNELKQELMPVVNVWTYKPINRAKVDEIAEKYLSEYEPNAIETARANIKKNHPPGDKSSSNLFVKRATTPSIDELTKMQKAQYLMTKLSNNINKGELGQVGFQVGKRAAIDPSVNTDDELTKDWYKQNYARDWLLEKPFKPKEDPKDLKWQAYVELRKENNLEP